jgi:hypothetical protein
VSLTNSLSFISETKIINPIKFLSLVSSKHDSDTVRMQEMASNFLKKLWGGGSPQTPLESLRRFATLNGDTTDRGPKLLVKLANTTDSLHLG